MLKASVIMAKHRWFPDDLVVGGTMDLLGFGGENSFYICSRYSGWGLSDYFPKGSTGEESRSKSASR